VVRDARDEAGSGRRREQRFAPLVYVVLLVIEGEQFDGWVAAARRTVGKRRTKMVGDETRLLVRVKVARLPRAGRHRFILHGQHRHVRPVG